MKLKIIGSIFVSVAFIIFSSYTLYNKSDDKDVFRIDKPIAEDIVSKYSKIGIAYTAISTKEKSENLLNKIAEKQGKQIKIKEFDYLSSEVLMPTSPLQLKHLFIGGVDMVQTTATYGNPAGETVAKEWNDFIGVTPEKDGDGPRFCVVFFFFVLYF